MSNNNRDNSWKKRVISRVSIVMMVVQIAASVAFFLLIVKLNILPVRIIILLGVCIMITNILTIVTRQFRKTRIVSCVIAALMVFVFGTGIFYGAVSFDTLNEISDVSISREQVCLYVLSDDAANEIEDIRDYRIGLLGGIGKTSFQTGMDMLEQLLNADLLSTEYRNMTELIQALTEGEVNAILSSKVYISMLSENDEEYKNIGDKLRLLWAVNLDRNLEIKVDATDTSAINYVSTDEDEVLAADEMPFILYISGNDADGKLASNGRSDVNMLMVINPISHRILLLNTPRDYYVDLVSMSGKDKLTNTSILGTDESMRILSRLYGVPVKYFLRLNFTGFMEIVDAMGGIDVESEVSFTVAHWYYKVGMNHLSGIEALAFARERYSFEDGDRQRGRNQQAVIRGIIDKAASFDTVVRFTNIMDALSDTIETNLSAENITSLARLTLDGDVRWEIESFSVDGSDSSGECVIAGGTYYMMEPDMSTVEAAKGMIASVLEAGE